MALIFLYIVKFSMVKRTWCTRYLGLRYLMYDHLEGFRVVYLDAIYVYCACDFEV